jgi:hypothetical protein
MFRETHKGFSFAVAPSPDEVKDRPLSPLYFPAAPHFCGMFCDERLT